MHFFSIFAYNKKKMNQEVDDLPSGPLDIYRKKASFNWKDMLFFIEGEEIHAFKVAFYSKRNPQFRFEFDNSQ